MAKLNIESTIKELLVNEQVKDKIEELVPGLTKSADWSYEKQNS